MTDIEISNNNLNKKIREVLELKYKYREMYTRDEIAEEETKIYAELTRLDKNKKKDPYRYFRLKGELNALEWVTSKKEPKEILLQK